MGEIAPERSSAPAARVVLLIADSHVLERTPGYDTRLPRIFDRLASCWQNGASVCWPSSIA